MVDTRCSNYTGLPPTVEGGGATLHENAVGLHAGVDDLGASNSPASSLGLKRGPVIEQGGASWYGDKHHGLRTASGEAFLKHDYTAAHRTLPFGTRVLVRDIRTGLEVVVRITDRGPNIRGRVIDVSKAAAKALGMIASGHDLVEIRALLPTKHATESIAGVVPGID